MPKKQIIKIQGSEKLLIEKSGMAYYVKHGLVYVYVVPYKDGKACRRHFLMECKDGDTIIGINRDERFLDADDVRHWNLLIVPMEETELVEYEADEISYKYFAKKLDLKFTSPEQLELDVIEKYRISQIKYLRNIYADTKGTHEAKKNSFITILKQFTSSKTKNASVRSTSPLYSAIAYICNKNDIDIITYGELKSACGTRFSVEDFAHLSGFPVRKVVLDENWYRKDGGDLLVYDKESGKPLVASQKGSYRYLLFDPQSGGVVRLSSEVASRLKDEAYAFYRPLPAKPLSFKDIIAYAKSQIKSADIALTIFLLFVGTLISLLLPTLNEKVYDMYIPFGDETGLKNLCMLLVSIMLGNVAFTLVRGLSGFRNSSRLTDYLEAALVDRVFNISDADIGDIQSADLIQRMMSLSSILSMVYNIVMTDGISLVLSFIFFIKMYTYSDILAKTGFVMILIVALVLAATGFTGYKISNRQLELDGKISSMLYQMLAGVSKLKMAGAEEKALNQYIVSYSEEMGLTRKLSYRSNTIAIISGASSLLFSIVLFYTMIRNSVGISVGQYMGFSTAFSSFSAAFIKVASTVSNTGLMMPILERAKVLLDSIPEAEIEKTMPSDITGDIEIDNVKFAYSEDGPMVLEDINLHIHPGEYLGIVGSSGCGKSTLLKLLLGFEKPIDGKIFYDGQDLDDLNKKQLRRNLGIVLQDGAIISGSIADNIRLTSPNASIDEINKVLEDVGLKDDVDAMPMGLNTVLSEGTGQISGGQKQRLLIARAIISNPKVLFFDEATSALDNITQAHLADSLAGLNATRVVIAHRLSTVQQCDRIIVLDKGRVVESGTFSELMELDGLFAQFAKRQVS